MQEASGYSGAEQPCGDCGSGERGEDLSGEQRGSSLCRGDSSAGSAGAGIIVFAKNQRAAGELSRQMRQGEMEKLYLAAVDGIPCQEQDRLEDELEKIPGSNLSKVTEKKTASSKKAILEYKVLKTQEGRALLEIRLYTGRHHQIRVQLAHRGMPICGDSKYNPKCRENNGQWQELALCAYKLSFQHPVLKKKMEFTAMPVGNFPMV